MGRYKRKKRLYGNDATGRSGSHAKVFSAREKKRLIQYLKDYRKGARAVATGRAENIVEASAATQVQIASMDLPVLTKEVLTKPYLELPPQMNGQQRKVVHECCVLVCLYHCGVGVHGSDQRYVAISVYVDGFAFLEGKISKPDYLGFYRPFRPWFYRTENSLLARYDTTKEFRDIRIQELIDQPGKCIRDGIDDMDLAGVERDDLSGMSPPEIMENATGELGEETDQWLLVDTPEKMEQCTKELLAGNPKEISFDVEAYNVSKYVQLTCLLQISSDLGREYVIDVLAPGVWDRVCGLAPLFADPSFVKVGHSIGGLDVKCLHRDFGIFICNAFDTYEAAKVLNLRPQGLLDVCKHYGLSEPQIFSDLKSTYQTTDWRRRPLTKEMILYGRFDVHFLLKLRRLMMRDLIRGELRSSLHDIEAESELVAASLAATLQKIKDSEDAEGYGESATSCNNSENLVGDKTMTLDTLRGDEGNDDDDDDEQFFTPQTSIRWGNENSILEAVSFDADAEEEFHVPNGDAVASKNGTSLAQTVTALEMRMQPELMRVITVSQDRCRDVWTAQSEPHFRNAVFMSLMQQPLKGCGKNNPHAADSLSNALLKLYEELVRLRSNIAAKQECIPHFVCSLNDLAWIAYVRPTSLGELRLISYFLPEALATSTDDPTSFTRQIFALTRKALQEDSLSENNPDRLVLRCNEGLQGGSSSDGSGVYRTAKRAAIVSAIVGGITLTVLALSRRRRGK